MKAFQLKIVIKNSKPPIWRRVIVPAGITFSQLSIILNQVMGWDGYHLFEFEFYNEGIRIGEDMDETSMIFDSFDCLEASKTFIREYLEENKSFMYTYDFGDDWQHRVTVEKILPDCELNYPKVVKYKGNCPPEDCGGIYGYYMLLDRLSNQKHLAGEEEEDAWLEEWEYPVEVEYDMEKVNEILKNNFFYHWGKAERRFQHKIYEDHAKGKLGLKATKNDKNKQKGIRQTKKQQMENTFRFMADLLESEEFNEEMLDNIFDDLYGSNAAWKDRVHMDSLKDIFSDFTKEEIMEMAKKKGVKGISRCSKQALIKKVVDFMLQPEIMERYFGYLLDKEIEDFETLIKEPEKQELSELKYLSKLYEPSYIGMLDIGVYGVTKDVAEVYKSIRTEEFEQKRKRNSYLLSCLRAAALLYGITPVKIILEMMKTNSKIEITEEEVRKELEQLPPEYNDYIIVGDMIYFEMLYPDDRGLLRAQAGKEYYIPTMEEIIDLGTLSCLPNQKELKKLVYFLQHQLGLFKEHAEWVGKIIQTRICGDCEINDIFEFLEEEEICIENQRQLEKLTELIKDLWNHTRMIVNRGFTPDEILRKSKSQKLPLKEQDNIINFETARKKKIYPNDSCPCGSGKKYKNCCGKK